jgi:hypothetical protein
MTGCQMTWLSKWLVVKMTGCQNDWLSKWLVVKMTGWKNDLLTKWLVVEMTCCQNECFDKMTSCQNDCLSKWLVVKIGWRNDCQNDCFDKMTGWSNDLAPLSHFRHSQPARWSWSSPATWSLPSARPPSPTSASRLSTLAWPVSEWSTARWRWPGGNVIKLFLLIHRWQRGQISWSVCPCKPFQPSLIFASKLWPVL